MPDDERIRGAGWLHDPTRRHQIRYWDGHRWTERVSDNGRRTIDALADQPLAPTRPVGAHGPSVMADAAARFGVCEMPTFKVTRPTVSAG